MNAGQREFVDTNILVYAYDRSHRDKHSVDALVIHSAMKLGSYIIWSEDLSPGQYYQGIQIVNPFLPSKD